MKSHHGEDFPNGGKSSFAEHPQWGVPRTSVKAHAHVIEPQHGQHAWTLTSPNARPALMLSSSWVSICPTSQVRHDSVRLHLPRYSALAPAPSLPLIIVVS